MPGKETNSGAACATSPSRCASSSAISLVSSEASSYEVTTLLQLRSRAALGRHRGVRPTSHSEGTFWAHVEGGSGRSEASPTATPKDTHRVEDMCCELRFARFSEVTSRIHREFIAVGYTKGAKVSRGGSSLRSFTSVPIEEGMGMRKIILSLASVALVVLLSLGLSGSMPREVGALSAKPNIVFILADDMRKDDLKYMPKTRSALQDKGMSFENAFVSHALCCPSRATIMRGQYAHNTHVWSNGSTDSSSTTSGGLQAYKDNGGEQDNVATRLDAAGYRTGLFGKYLNGYDGSTKPTGWDRWFGGVMGGDEYYNYDVNDDGTLRHFGTTSSDYSTDVISRKTNTFISSSASLGTPFFAYVAPVAPHAPSTPAPRDVNTFDGEKAPRLPSFNERDVSDKPSWIRQLPRLTSEQIAAIDGRHEKRVRSLQALDDLVKGVVDTLNNAGAMDDTYIFFTSDNGFHHGEHRILNGKWR